MKQTTNAILMIRPNAFGMNGQTAANNHFQKPIANLSPEAIHSQALEEFDTLVQKLRFAGIQILVIDDLPENDAPDSIFPNNWISFHDNADVALYPMFAENRRKERREDLLDLLEDEGFEIENIVDYTEAEDDGYFLEGTGSMVFDRANGKAYCALSPRSDEELFIEFCEDFDMAPIVFEAFQTVDGTRQPIYHTNVMMCIGERFAVICADCIDDKPERKAVLESLRENNKEIILITEAQVSDFAGNMLEVQGGDQHYVVMSDAAHASLQPDQILKIEKHGRIIKSNINTIEAFGGGSVRCMLAEIFLPKV